MTYLLLIEQKQTFLVALISVVPFNVNQKLRDDDIESRIDSLGTYLKQKTLKLFFDNVNIVDDDKQDLLVLFQDKSLKEDYGGVKYNLIYWLMWNIPKNTKFLESKIYDKVENDGNDESNYRFFEMYPYVI